MKIKTVYDTDAKQVDDLPEGIRSELQLHDVIIFESCDSAGETFLITNDYGPAPAAYLTAEELRTLGNELIEMAGGPWKPIGTAPREEGAFVDLWYPTYGRVTGGFFYRQMTAWATYFKGVTNIITSEQPTHWMEIPKGPGA